jgi:hypothetical protein
MAYWGFDNQRHMGKMVVNVSVARDVVQVFRALYDDRFPIKEMVPEDAYHGNDNLAAAADDTSGFNCRYVVAPGPKRWSVHAYGEAIDVNDVQNPLCRRHNHHPSGGPRLPEPTGSTPGRGSTGRGPRGSVRVSRLVLGWALGLLPRLPAFLPNGRLTGAGGLSGPATAAGRGSPAL